MRSKDSAEARRIRASWFLEQERPIDAVQDIWAAIRQDPTDVRTNAMLVKAIRKSKTGNKSFDANEHYRQLVTHLQRQVNAAPDEKHLRQYLSSAMWALSDRDGAIKNLEVGIARDPRHVEMQEILVDYLVSDRRYDQAKEVFNRIPQRAVDRGRREFMKGRLQMSQKEWTDAIESFEMALGFAHSDPSMASRARVCLALCRRENGDNARAMDDYRSLVKSNPDFEGGRLGIASAYLRSEQVNLAIAEYRQLLHVDGVPEFLANLMIKNNLTLPESSRDWSEIELLLSDKNPRIKDEIQRVLLQADLLFAKGYPSQAMDLLDDAARRLPGRAEIGRAFQRLSSVHGDQLLQRIRKVLDEDPTNLEAHSSMLRMYAARKDQAGLTNWMNGLATNRTFPRLNDRQRLQILAETSTSVAEAEEHARGASPQSHLMLQYGQEAWRQLARNSAKYVFGYVNFLARHRPVGEAMDAINGSGQQLSPDSAAYCWLECVRQHPQEQSGSNRASNELIQLIRKEPANFNLRVAFAEYQMLTKQYSAATTLLKQITAVDNRNGRAFGHLAWLAALIQNDTRAALQLSEKATRFAPSDPGVRSIRGLALALSNQAEAGLNVLRAIPVEERTMVTEVFAVKTLLLAGQKKEATELLQKLSSRPIRGNLAEAEINLLRSLQQELNIQPASVTLR